MSSMQQQQQEDMGAIIRKMKEEANITPAQEAAAREKNIKEWTPRANTELEKIIKPQTPPPPPSEPQTPPIDEVCGETGGWTLDSLFPSSKRESPSPQPASEPQIPPIEPNIQQHAVPFDFTKPANNSRSKAEETNALIRRIVKKHKEAHTTPASEASAKEYNLKQWTSWANTALDYYNNKLGTKFKFVRIIGVVSDAVQPLRLVHITFKAKSDDDGSYRNFFAEMRVPWKYHGSYRNFLAEMRVPWKDQLEEPIVYGCCTLEKTDSGEDLNVPVCSHCCIYSNQPHPTPRYGYRSSSGDLFANMASYY